MFEPVTDTHEVNVMKQFSPFGWVLVCANVSMLVHQLYISFNSFFFLQLFLCYILLLYYKLLETVQQTVLNSVAL